MNLPTLVYPEFLAMHNPVGKSACRLAFKKQGGLKASGVLDPDPTDVQKVRVLREVVKAEVCDAFFLTRIYATAKGEDLSGSLSLHLDGAGVLLEKITDLVPPEGSINCLDPMPWYRPMLTFPAIAVEGDRANLSKQAGWIVPHAVEIEVYLHRYMPRHPIQLEVTILGAIYTTQGVNHKPDLELWDGKAA